MDAKSLVRIALMAALTAAGAYMAVPIPNLPFTMQTFFALLAGLMLSRKDSVIAMLVYIALGLIGLPVFAGGGGGISYVLYPTFGYVVFLPVLVFIISTFKKKNVWLSVIIPEIFLLLFGGAWLILIAKLYVGKSVGALIITLIVIYIPVELVKSVLGILVYKRLKFLSD